MPYILGMEDVFQKRFITRIVENIIGQVNVVSTQLVPLCIWMNNRTSDDEIRLVTDPPTTRFIHIDDAHCIQIPANRPPPGDEPIIKVTPSLNP